MAQRTWRPGARSDPATRSADAVSTWLETYPGPPDGLVGLGDLGASVNEDLAADLDLKPIRTLRLSLELLGALAEGEGLDPETPPHSSAEILPAFARRAHRFGSRSRCPMMSRASGSARGVRSSCTDESPAAGRRPLCEIR